MVSCRSARKLSSYSVCAKLYLLETKEGSCECGNLRCEVCNNIEDIYTFIIIVTGEPFKINHNLWCNDKCLRYLSTFEVCKKQYRGKIFDRSTIIVIIR